MKLPTTWLIIFVLSIGLLLITLFGQLLLPQPSQAAMATATIPSDGTPFPTERPLFLPLISQKPFIPPLPPCDPSPPGEADDFDTALILCDGQTVFGQVDDRDQNDFYRVYLTVNRPLTVTLDGVGLDGSGDTDLALYDPARNQVAVSTGLANEEQIVFRADGDGYWTIRVFDCCPGDGGAVYELQVDIFN